MPTHHLFTHTSTFELESGDTLPELRLAYATYGTLNERRDNVVWVCHALTGSPDFTDWWCDLFGDGKLYDPREWFVVCANTLGGCYGSTGPLSINPKTQQPYYHTFPQVTNRDVVGAFDLLRQHLGLERVHTLLGGSLGGQQALEWALQQPEIFERLVHVASNARHSPWGIAFNESQRMAIRQDPSWGTATETAGAEGLKTARAIAMLSYRHYNTYAATQQEPGNSITDNFRASSYQVHQGEKLAKRFNAYTYWHLSKAMDSHHVGRDRGGLEKALAQVKARTLFVGVNSDLLFPVEEQRFMHAHVPGSSFYLIDSNYGHDGFLVEFTQLKEAIVQFYQGEQKEAEVDFEQQVG
ncbi:homoserine O-acetyltransferase [Pontibacter sp. E15-1]|uniref:homoserine O-acetyltransferase MetX n=1 Tax=Pontibacter sp. E15-1 TaxID=2919918 RepID=UPI001F501DCE|nr:homoserine O-acetyltransferase [Pontibacter sp. E15-1]MCJ8164613.1 homoserine O-acetyltransferase [Pontibacter sp. E15-1]